MVLVLLPSKAQTYRRHFRTASEPEEADARLVKQLCEQYRTSCLDLGPHFHEQALAGEQLHFRIDGHWNAAGNRLAARMIYDYLVKNRLLQMATRKADD